MVSTTSTLHYDFRNATAHAPHTLLTLLARSYPSDVVSVAGCQLFFISAPLVWYTIWALKLCRWFFVSISWPFSVLKCFMWVRGNFGAHPPPFATKNTIFSLLPEAPSGLLLPLSPCLRRSTLFLTFSRPVAAVWHTFLVVLTMLDLEKHCPRPFHFVILVVWHRRLPTSFITTKGGQRSTGLVRIDFRSFVHIATCYILRRSPTSISWNERYWETELDCIWNRERNIQCKKRWNMA